MFGICMYGTQAGMSGFAMAPWEYTRAEAMRISLDVCSVSNGGYC